ncbi:hypothetical protein [Haloarcula amylolytica]|uniref:hypothetical protein n=1 Tax=Haloarcula amylolytica TaxID=396317 RepID=UPI00373FD00B
MSEPEFSIFRVEVFDIAGMNSPYARTGVPEQFDESVNFSSPPLISKMLKDLTSSH